MLRVRIPFFALFYVLKFNKMDPKAVFGISIINIYILYGNNNRIDIYL
jgi:hypothetical protein